MVLVNNQAFTYETNRELGEFEIFIGKDQVKGFVDDIRSDECV